MENKYTYVLKEILNKVKTTQCQKYKEILNDDYTKFIYDPCICIRAAQILIDVICPNTYTTSDANNVKYEIQANNDNAEIVLFNLAKNYLNKQIHLNNVKQFMLNGCSEIIDNMNKNITLNVQAADSANLCTYIIKDSIANSFHFKALNIFNKYLKLSNNTISNIEISGNLDSASCSNNFKNICDICNITDDKKNKSKIDKIELKYINRKYRKFLEF